MAKKKDTVGFITLILIVGAVNLAIEHPLATFGIVGLAFAIWVMSKTTAKTPNQAIDDRKNTAPSPPSRSASSKVQPPPRKPASAPNMQWIPPGASINHLGLTIPGGMLYIGSDESFAPDPCLINSRSQVSATAPDVSISDMDYWPSYSRVTPTSRRTYLEWLRTGRKDPRANIGYVFLAFYALERRATVDAPLDATARGEFPQIFKEINRLLVIYGENRSFRNYAEGLLAYMEGILASTGELLVDERNSGLGLKIRLGRIVHESKPLPAPLAAAWARADQNVAISPIMGRCWDLFEKAFIQAYTAKHGEGIRVSPPRLRLNVTYQAASSALRGITFETRIGELPDVGAATTAQKKLQGIVEEAEAAMAPYARYIGRTPGSEESLEAALLLPPDLWPSSARNALDAISARIGNGLLGMRLGELAQIFGAEKTVNRDRAQALANALEAKGFGFEPDILAGARTPKMDDVVVIFRTEAEDSSVRNSVAYRAACVTIDLACAAVAADEKVSAAELRLLTAYINSLSHLPSAQRLRLRARAKAGITDPPSLASLKRQIDLIPVNARRDVAHLLSAIVHADGEVTVSEVRMVEKAYKTLGVDVGLAHTDLHAIATGSAAGNATGPALPLTAVGRSTTNPGSKPASDEFFLDTARIAALQADTERVNKLLANVFVDEAPQSEPTIIEKATAVQHLLGLDAAHDAFLRVLISRPSWAREDLAAAASDMELMLEGALERINEASFDHYGEGLLDGDDPLIISRDLIEVTSP